MSNWWIDPAELEPKPSSIPPNGIVEAYQWWVVDSPVVTPEKSQDDNGNWWQNSVEGSSTPLEESKDLVFPHGAENPYTDYAAAVAISLAGLDLDGSAQVVTSKWDWWNMGRHVVGPQDVEPQKFRTISFQKIAEKAAGWKFHLNFDAEDLPTVLEIGTFLTALAEQGVISRFKIGKGGGKASGQPGKEATVYVGHRDKANLVAPIIEEALGAILDPPEGTALDDDIPFTEHVMGRFEISRIDFSFHQYGAKGHPRMNEDIDKILMSEYHNLDEVARRQLREEMVTRADAVLRQRFATFYTGSF